MPRPGYSYPPVGRKHSSAINHWQLSHLWPAWRLSVLIGLVLLGFASSPGRPDANTWPHEAREDNFVIHAEFPLAEIQPLLAQLPVLQAQVRVTLQLDPRDEPIHVFLFASARSFRAYVQYYFPDAPLRPALFIKRNGLGMIFAHRSPTLEQDLRHEVTHAVLHAHLPLVPLWLDEGLAKYFEPAETSRPPGRPPARPRGLPRTIATVPIHQLEQWQTVQQMGQREYAQAWAWVHFLLHGPPPARAVLLHYLAQIQQQQVPAPLSLELRRHVPAVESQFESYWRQR